MTEFIPGISWQTFNAKNKEQTDSLINSGFKMLRIFIDMANLPQSEPTQSYIANFMNTVDGLHYWTYEGKTGLFQSNVIVKDSFDFCLKNGWLPVCCLGYREEQPHNWLGRNPSADKWLWLGKFAKSFAMYLANLGFPRADVEIWNEPSKVFGWDAYSELAYIMGSNWKSVNPNYKLHVFADDSFRTDYLKNIMTNTDLMGITDYIPIHVGVGTEQEEWDNNQIHIVKDIISKIPHLKLAVTEMSPNGKWEHMKQLIDNGVSMYGLFWAIRKEEVGTAFVIDDIWQIRSDQSVLCSSPAKRDFLKYFNKLHYKPYEIIVEDFDMKLEDFYYKKKVTFSRDTKKAGIRFIQSVVGVTPDSIWGTETETKVRLYQEYNKLDIDGIVGPVTFRDMMKTNPPAYIDLQYFTATGTW